MNPRYDIDWYQAFEAWQQSGKSMAKFWREDLSGFCRSPHFPTYSRFVKHLQNCRQRSVHFQSIRHDSPTATICPIHNEVRLIELTQEQIGRFTSEYSKQDKPTAQSVQIRYPNGIEVQFHCVDPVGLVYALTGSYSK